MLSPDDFEKILQLSKEADPKKPKEEEKVPYLIFEEDDELLHTAAPSLLRIESDDYQRFMS